MLLAICVLSVSAFAADESPATLITHGHFKQARAIVQQQLRENPRNVTALILMARIHLAYDNYEEAGKLLKEAVAIDSGSSDAHVYLAEAYGQKIQKSGVFDKIGMAKTIRKESERAVAADPKNIDALESLMEFHAEAPGIVGGNKDKARDLAEEIAQINPVRGDFARATIAGHDKEFSDQKKFQLHAVEVDPQSYDALVGAARLYLSDRWLNYDTAADFAARAIAVDPTRVRGYSVLAQSYAAQGKLVPLQQLLGRAEAHVPDDLSPYFYAGQTLVSSGKNWPIAEKYLRKYLSQEAEGESPSLGEAHWRLGQALERQGRKDDAIQEMETAVQLKPELKQAQKDLKRLKS